MDSPNPVVQLENLARSMGQLLMQMMDEFPDHVRCVDTPEVVIRQNLRFAPRGNGIGHPGFKKAGQDGVYPDSMPTILPGKRFRQPQQGRLRRGVCGLADGRVERRVTGNEYDVAMALFNHPWQNRRRAIRRALIVHRENLVPRRFLQSGQRCIASDSGGTDQ